MSKFINCPCLQKIKWMKRFILKENGLLPQGGKRRTTREQKFWIAVRVFLFCFCFYYFYLVRRFCFSHFITKILRSLQISVYRQNVPYNVLLKVQLLHILEISTGPFKVADDHTLTPYEMTPGFKPFTAWKYLRSSFVVNISGSL